MSVNTSILTTTAKEATELRVAGYQNAVAAHIGGDWSRHTQMRVHNAPFTELTGDTVSSRTLRVGTTRDNAGVIEDVVLAMPIISTGSLAVSQGIAPIFIIPPGDASFAVGSIAQLSVVVISATAPTFQWYKQRTTSTAYDAVSGASYSTLTIPNVHAVSAGVYRCVATNDFGSTTSDSCNLTVS